MPKQQLTINAFEGGMNTNSDPRDIADNEFSVLKGVNVDYVGTLRLMGSHGNHSIVTAVTTFFAEGYGIFPFSSAYDDAGALVSTNYLALTDGSYVRIFDDGGPNSGNAAFDGMSAVASTGFSLGDTASTPEEHIDVYASMYTAGGNLRVNDGNFTNYANVPKLLQYIQSKDYGKGTNTTYPTTLAQASVGGDWVVNNSNIETGVTSSNLKMINLGSVAKGIVEGNSLNDSSNDSGADYIKTNGVSGNVITVTNANFDHGINDKADHYYNGSTCSLFKSGQPTIYGVVYAYNYNSTDSGNAESAFSVWTGPDGDVTPEAALAALSSPGADETWSFQVGQSDGYMWNSELNGQARGREVISDDWGVTLTFNEGTTGNGGWMPETTTRYKFYNSTIFDGNQESNPEVFTMYPRKSAAGETAHEAVTEMFFCDEGTAIDSDGGGSDNTVGTASSQIPVTFGLLMRMRSDNSPGSGNFTLGNSSYSSGVQDTSISPGTYNFLGINKRVTGGRIWWASNEDGYKKLYLLMEYDMERGARIITGESSGDGAFAPWVSWVYPVASNPVVRPNWTVQGSTEITNPPIVEDYESLVLYPPDAKLQAKWKTSVVASGRTYIGNIKRQQKSTFDGGGTWHQSATPTNDPEYPDRIVASPRGRFDTFPEDPNYEFSNTPGDGDKIIKLETFANRLIVFYSNKLEIYALPAEELEQEAPYIGLDGEHPSQACLTEFGVAWINSQGVYFYGGDKVTSLSDKIRNMWIGSTLDGWTPFWKSNANDVPSIAYDPRAKKLLIAKTISSGGTDSEHILQFSFKTQAWTYKQNALTDDSSKRFTIYKGDLVFDDGTRLQTWDDTSAASPAVANAVYFQTKDIDFGAPGVRKKIYKVYITYKTSDGGGGVASNIQVRYGVNGDITPTEAFKDGDNFSSEYLTDAHYWQIAELKPNDSGMANNIYSFRLSFGNNNGVDVPVGFEINDITIVYRIKNIR